MTHSELCSMEWHGTLEMCHPRCVHDHPLFFIAKQDPITLQHLAVLRNNLNLSNNFDAAMYATMAISFWCQCHLTETCVESSFNMEIHSSWSSPQKWGRTASIVLYHSFLAPSTKTRPQGEYMMWTDSSCLCSTEWPFSNHLEINCGVPPSSHLFGFESDLGI